MFSDQVINPIGVELEQWLQLLYYKLLRDIKDEIDRTDLLIYSLVPNIYSSNNF